MGLFDELFNTNDEDKKKKELEKKMNDLGLDEWEKQEIRNGNYDLDSFEDEDLEDDDYYYDE
jgi:hypothetical protein